MRSELLDPTDGHARLTHTIALSSDVYRLVESGQDFSGPIRQLALVAKRPIGMPEVLGAFGSISPVTFAKKLLIDWNNLPKDLTYDEMLDLLIRVVQASGDEFQTEYWVECLRVNTGDENISDLIFWPGEYFGDGDNSRELSPASMLATAIAAGSSSRGT